MKHTLIVIGSLFLLAAVLVSLVPTATVRALPEYSAQTGEPCATCHVSPSGGGPRGPRGQAWVASSKPGAVPDLVQALELLGVELTVDATYFMSSGAPIPEAEMPGTAAWQAQPVYRWLSNYDGN